jgi:predicted transcriptional regulator
MKKSLLEVIFASDKRKDTLLLLQEGPKEMEFLLRSLNTIRQALLPQIRILENHYLVDQHKDTYKLTTLGETIVDKMLPLLDVVEVFDDGIDYWGTRSLDFIPPHLLERLGEVGKCEAIIPHLTDVHELNQDVVKASYKSKAVFKVTTFCHPHFPNMFCDLIDKNVSVYIIMSKDLLDSVRCNYSTECSKLLKSKLFHLFTYPNEMGLQGFVLNDYYVLMRLFNSIGETDYKHIVCTSPSALEWGKELFEYYLKDSIPVVEL